MTFNKKITLIMLTFVVLCVSIVFVVLPGQQKSMAWTLATGIGISELQEHVDTLEYKAIHKEDFNEDDIEFLKDLFLTFSTGARYSLVLSESGNLTSHYLSCSGEDYNLPNHLFNKNKRVKKEMNILKNRMLSDISQNTIKDRYETKRFYMPDSSVADSIYSLYYGKVILSPKIKSTGIVEMHWRAEVPWYWPEYDYLKEKYDDYKAHSFSVPNFKSIFIDKENRLNMDDGLGQHMVVLGIAKPFLAYSEWKGILKI